MSNYSAALTSEETQAALAAEEEQQERATRIKRPDSLPPKMLRELSQLSPARTVWSFAHVWGSIVFTIWLAQTHLHWAFLPLVWLFIGSRQVALLVLVHDAAHNLLFRNKRLNDWSGELLAAWPITGSMHAYRRVHFAHHRNLNTERDPDHMRNRPWELREVTNWKDFALKLTGLKSGEAAKALKVLNSGDQQDGFWQRARWVYFGAAAVLLTITQTWLLFGLYWVIPYAWTLARRRLHGVAEHWAVKDEQPLNQSRTTLHNPFEKLVFSPFNSGFHLEHHLYPCVPWFNLPKVHAALMENEEFRANAQISDGLVEVGRELAAYPRWNEATTP